MKPKKMKPSQLFDKINITDKCFDKVFKKKRENAKSDIKVRTLQTLQKLKGL